MVEYVNREERKNGKFDIIHGHDWMIYDALEKLNDHTTIIGFHSTEKGRVGRIVGEISERIVEKERVAGEIADKVVTVSGVMKSELEGLYGFPPEKVHVVPNGSFTQDLEKDIDSGILKEEYGFDESEPLVMFLGRMEYQKGPDVLVEAMPHILNYRNDANFVMAGKGGMMEQVESKIRDFGISDKVKMAGYISEEEKLDLLNATDVVCIPSRNEPFGLVLFEAWAAGDAVVASNVGGLGENIDNFENGIKTRPDPQPLAWGTNFVIDDSGLVERLGRKGKKKLKEFRWDRIARRIVLIYEEALSG
jgi:glycosyltransferase involved in cell wall biosynthesis